MKEYRAKLASLPLLFGMVLFLFAVPGQAASLLQYSDKGEEVAKLQERLGTLGFYAGVNDGIFGEETKQAVKSFQRSFNLDADGIVGQATWKALRDARPAVSRYRSGSLLAEQIIRTTMKYRGVPYLWGGTTPAGFDCSGFTQFVLAQYGIKLPRTADLQYQAGIPVGYSQLSPGDLVFFSTYEPGPSHNGIYIGNGYFISATSSRGVAVDPLASPYWKARYIGARRIIR
ncbi:NlpC/P60 family protein [Anaeroselena agilis]|uniref:NlpC/P60 family protein n=1 Tax=Anaeroselena agilis TaxID=3063788 RepID=A0ABU3NS64_9FIRM|nr:NlpC/P60 family protein [Selenomonadales bacterium 4137-cl]